ncbi:tRNA/rRNA methyltransferase [Ralstonia sp. 25mfcol4.1]|uniref:RNA methyltransferase n=1 Tax=Burkholderiaceae TaxID=119060 RepID=UPI0008817615|nr:RNA methyltransferase [Ralstonia sp. 25mfcol4.1]SDO99101.1 tRNA/rRNA methyltransferase [Ralstonia sp. 25mfcol4.1]
MTEALNSQAEPIPVEAAASGASGIFSRVRVVLVETSHPGNVGSVARAMKTMGFGGQLGSLVLVSPREAGVLTHPDAVAMASGADDVLAGARIVDDVESALAGTAFTVAMTARQREFGPPRLLPRAAAARCQAMLAADGRGVIAFVFGNERYGLPNEAVLRCSAVTHIPANPAYASLNLAQAVQLIAYEMRLALLEAEPAQAEAPDGTRNIGYAGEPATAEQVESMFGHLQAGLVAIGFLDPDNPRKLMPRLRRMFARAGLEREEVNILRGIAKRMLLARDGDGAGPQARQTEGNKEG